MTNTEILKISKTFMEEYPKIPCGDIDTLILNLESYGRGGRWILFEDYNIPELLAFRIYTDTGKSFSEQAKNMISDYFSDLDEYSIGESLQCGIYDIKSNQFFFVSLSTVITVYSNKEHYKKVVTGDTKGG